jgi:ubiquinone/menaquinone biosynthesis C-methylase UbiE
MRGIEKHYDDKSTNYEKVRESLALRIYEAITWKYLEPLVPSDADSLVLDAGGGTGVWAIPMARKGCRVVLLDDSQKMLDIAQKKIRKEGLQERIEVRKGDMTKLDFPDETFDLVLSEHTLFLFEQPAPVIAELTRVLKKNHPMVVSAQNRLVQTLAHLQDNPMENPSIVSLANRILHKDEHDMLSKELNIKIFSLTPQEFHDLLENSGLLVKRIICKVATIPLRFFPKFFMRTDIPHEIESDILKLELSFSERPDAAALGAHLQATAHKK